MAETVILQSLLKENDYSFESLYKEFLNDNVSLDGIDEKIQGVFKKSCNSLRYWGKKLEMIDTSTMLCFTTFAPSPDDNASFVEIFQSLKEIFDLNKIKEIYFPENRRYLGIECYIEEDATFIRNNFLRAKNSFIVYTSWLAEAKIYKGRIHWLPNTVKANEVSSFLFQYFVINELKKSKVLLCDNFFSNTNVVEFSGLLKRMIDINNIPHITELHGHRILMTVRGRKPFCISCMKVGHLRSECDYVFCGVCKMKCLRSHTCSQEAHTVSYAEIIKANNGTDNDKDTTVKNIRSEESGDSQSDNGWLVVKRNSLKSYGKKKTNLMLDDQKNLDSVAWSGNVEGKSHTVAEETQNDMLVENIVDGDEKKNQKLSKRKLECVGANGELLSDGNMSKNKNIKENPLNISMSNVYDILSSDFSEECL